MTTECIGQQFHNKTFPKTSDHVPHPRRDLFGEIETIVQTLKFTQRCLKLIAKVFQIIIIADQMTQSGDYSYGTIFRRVRKGRSMAELRVDGIAGCLRTPRGGSARQILFKAGKGEYWARFLTPRECARLQGVPDEYRIEVPLCLHLPCYIITFQ